VIASSDSRELALLGAANASAAAHFQSAMAGSAGHQFEREPGSGLISYIASFPVRNDDGDVIGVAMLKKAFATQDSGQWGFERPFYFVDADGVVMLSNRPDALNRPLWPLSGHATVAEQFGATEEMPMLRAITGSAWTTFAGGGSYVVREAVPNSDWSMLIVNPSAGMFASRFLGIIITLQLALTALFHFVSKEHGVRDNLQMQRRQALQELANILEVKATTDALTGLFNRAKFDASLQHELARAERYGNPLSLVVYDVDHFKQVNDVYGHQAGDRVLIQLSDLVSRGIRQTDLLTRWGGEEFFLLLPDSDGPTAARVAEKLRTVIAEAPFDQVGGITCSFGVTEYVGGDSAESLVARADNALYRAKLNGRNRVALHGSTATELPAAAPARVPPV
jgi:diguanylate cyclase (GGDEF)-like protein